MSESTTNSASQPQNSDFHFNITTGQNSNTVYEIQAIEDATSNCLFTISKTSEDASYQIKNLSGAPVSLKDIPLQRDEEKLLNLGDQVSFKILQSNGEMRAFPFMFWPMKVQGQEELIRRESDPEAQDERKCSICSKYLYRCMTLNPCDHKFCSSCLSKYLEKNLKNVVCPKCHAHIEGFFKRITGHRLSDDIDSASNPDLQISEEEKAKMDQGDLILKGAKLKIYEDKSVYFGFFKGDKREGKGRFVDSQQNEYDGEWKKDKKDGDGTCVYVNGVRYEGVWKNDRKNGLGDWRKGNGDKYNGGFVDDKFEGEGKFFFANGDKYEGKWKNDVFEGDGEFTWINQDKYRGKFKDNKLEGFGEFLTASGTVYKGDFKENKRHGIGEYLEKDGEKYKGGYKEGKREGKGELTFANGGGKFSGDWKEGKIEGQGEFLYANGEKYKGEWKNGMRNGHGKLIKTDGKKEVGQWKDDVFIGPDVKDSKDAKDAKVKVEKTPKGDDKVEKTSKGEGQEKKGFLKKVFSNEKKPLLETKGS